MYAIVQTGGKQFQVAKGDILEIEKLDAQAGDQVTLDQVLLVRDGENLLIGQPIVENASVKAKVLAHDKAKKVLGFKALTSLDDGLKSTINWVRDNIEI